MQGIIAGAESISGALERIDASRLDDEAASPWLPDSPTNLERDVDAFGVTNMVDQFVALVSSSRPPFTLSLSGVWGSGKSTFAQAVVQRLRRSGQAAVLIDAWTEDVSQLRRTLVIAVAAAMEGRGDDGAESRARERVAKRIDDETRNSRTEPTTGTRAGTMLTLRAIFRDPVGFTASILVALLILVVLAVSAPDSVAARALAPILGTFIGFLLVNSGFFFVVRGLTVTTGPAEAAVVLAREFRNAVTGEGLKNAPGRTLVVVDNLDRLPAQDAITALAEIRSLVEIKGSRCVFVIPVDRGALVGHIRGALSSDSAGKADLDAQTKAADDYLDKFFNLDLVLTQPQPVDIRLWALREARKVLSSEDEDDLLEAVQIVAYAAGAATTAVSGPSPRSVKRLLNGVSTRQRLLPAPRPRLSQIALVECLSVRFPSFIRWLSQDPRRFVDLRRSVVEGTDAEFEDAVNRVPIQAQLLDRVGLRDFLTAFKDIEVGVPELAVILSLRPDREWPGVTDPTALRSAVWSGDAEAFGTAFDEMPSDEHEAALLGVVNRVVSSAGRFHRDGLAAITAAVPKIGSSATAAARLHRAATDALLRSDATTLGRLSPSVAAFMFEAGHTSSDSTRLASKLVEAIQTIAVGDVTSDNVQALRSASVAFDADALSKSRALLSQAPFPAQAPIFEDPVSVSLATGPVADSYVSRLGALPAPLEGWIAERPTVDRLVSFADADGELGPEAIQVASAFDAAVTNMSEAASDEALDLVDSIVELLSGVTGDEVNELSTTLASTDDPARGRLISAAMWLDVDDPTQQSAVREFDEWLAESDLKAADVGPVLEDHNDVLEAWSSEWVARLLAQWSRQGVAAFPEMVAQYGGDAGKDSLVSFLGSFAEPSQPAGVAIDLLTTDRVRLDGVVAQLAGKLATVNPSQLAQFATPLEKLRALSVEIDPILQGIETRALSATGSDLESWIVGTQALAEAGIDAASRLADALADRAAAVGLSSPAAARWLSATSTDDKTGAVMVVSSTIESPTLSISDAIGLARDVRRDVDRNAAIALSVARRIAAPGVSESDAAAALDELAGWKRQPRDTREEYQELLSSVAATHPALTEAVVTVKTRGQRRQ